MQQKRAVLLLVNSLSGKGNARRVSAILQNLLALKEIEFSCFEDKWPGEFAGFTEVWLVGGDGTVNYFINRYKSIPVPFAVFKGGTGNDLAWKLYGDISTEQQAELVLRSAPRGIDCGNCNGRLYANSLGIGFDGEVLRSKGAIRWLGGHLGYLLAVIGKILSFREFTFTITSGSQQFSGKYLLVIVNNSSRTGGGFMVSPRASLDDGKLDMVLCDKLSVLKRLRYLPVIEKGKHTALSFINYLQEPSFQILCGEEVFAQIDGELISGKTFDIRVIKEGLSVLY
ncbi:MAG: diacylglycerol kinase family protein [Ferruginibacter sp.]